MCVGQSQTPSLLSFLQVEVTRGYLLEHDEERYSAKREKVYSFMKIPREVEKFMTYGFMQCTDSFLYVYIFLPMRFLLALWALITRPISKCFGLQNSSKTVLTPAEICDILKAAIVVICSMLMFYVDTNIMYHLIKSQSVIKLYIFYNMLEVADRLFSAFGQDTIDALFWTATEPRDRRTEHLGVIPHMIFAVAYVFLHSLLVLFQATTLNVAINSNNKALLTIMMSNNFVELKGSVFKKFDKNNLFQVSCSDVRERFHLVILLLVVTLQTMKEYSWKSERFWVLLPDCVVVLVAEIFVDWIKHAFITRFNELQLDVYRDYTTSLAYDMAQTRQKHAFSDHSDLVARRMGFIPLPLGVVMIRVLVQSIHINSFSSVLICILGYLCIGSLKVLISIIVLGMACYFIEQHKQEKALINSPFSNRTHSPSPSLNKGGAQKDTATSPLKPAINVDNNSSSKLNENSNVGFKSSNLALNAGGDCTLGSTAIFANSTVDLKNATLNEELLKVEGDNIKIEPAPKVDEIITRSEPNINSEYVEEVVENPVYENCEPGLKKRAESEPSLASCGETENLS
ncbi:protein TAPT1 homolog isoform X2 [Agrilus planipennis]|uniref:Protein TAPT1 homolog isoform X2 n=1 Tax=Agrilus planipennis TaxID=224129 RepID=A0A1W4X088_AGRPL|nr:protein TAPT1 homolog isoform X2 [Agrilus planipennis]